MSNILLINTRPTRDYVRMDHDPGVERYFLALEERGPKLGDIRTEPNNGLLILGKVLRHHGHSVTYLDVNALEYKHFLQHGRFFTFQQMVDCIARAATDHEFLFFSSIVVAIDDTLATIDILKQRFPDRFMILGGTFPSLMPDYCLNRSKGVDALVIGEGEELCPKIVNAYVHHDFHELETAQGIYFRRGPHKPMEHREGFNIVDLERLGPLAFPDWSLLDPELGPHVYRVMTARGCGFKCSYCVPSHMCGHRVRYYDMEDVLACIREIKEVYGAKNYVIGDLTFFYDQKKSRDLLRRVADMNIDLPFWCQTHLSRINHENLTLLKQAGCCQLAVGVESINPSIIENINKGTTPRQVIEKLLLIKQHGIETQTYFIIGIPGDTAETIALNKEFIKYGIESGYIDRPHIGVYVPYPGPAAHEGMDIRSHDYRYYTQGIFRDIPTRAVFASKEMTSDQIDKAFINCLEEVGASLEKTSRHTHPSTKYRAINRVIQGAEAIYLLQRLHKRNFDKKMTVFNLVQSIRPASTTVISDTIYEEQDYVLCSAEAANCGDALDLLQRFDGAVDTILLDSDVKNEWSRDLLNKAPGKVRHSRLIRYHDLMCWARCIVHILLHQLEHQLLDVHVLITPETLLARRIRTILEDTGAAISLVDNLPPHDHEGFHAVISAALDKTPLQPKILDLIPRGGLLIDGGIGTVDDTVLQKAKAQGIRVFRPDMRKFIAAEIFLHTEFQRFFNTSVGMKNIQGLPLVAGGIYAAQGHVVVDSINAPKQILGITDGQGGLVPKEKLTAEQQKLILKASNILINQ